MDALRFLLWLSTALLVGLIRLSYFHSRRPVYETHESQRPRLWYRDHQMKEREVLDGRPEIVTNGVPERAIHLRIKRGQHPPSGLTLTKNHHEAGEDEEERRQRDPSHQRGQAVVNLANTKYKANPIGSSQV